MKKNTQIKCFLFVRCKKELAELTAGSRVYGKFVRATQTWIVTTYLPYDREGSQSFRVYAKQPHSCPANKLVLWTNQGRIMAAYRAQKVPIQVITQNDLYSRTPFDAKEMAHLARQSVAIIGLGSGGSKIAVELANAGIQDFVLCDPDILELANITRHEAGIFDIGKTKCQFAAELISRKNPAANITAYAEDIFMSRDIAQVNRILKRNLIVAATDRTDAQLMINEFAYRLKVPCVMGGCYEDARGGEVLYTLPDHKMPCLACLRAGLKQPEQLTTIDYSTAKGPEDYQGQPGLHAAIDFVTSVEIQFSLAILLRHIPGSRLSSIINPAYNYILIGTATAAGFYRFEKPFEVFFQRLKGTRQDCPVCGDIWKLLEKP